VSDTTITETPDERLRRTLAEIKENEHPLLHKGDIVTVGTKTRYEIEVAMRSIVVLKQTDRERRRRLIDPADIAKITVVFPTEETRAVLAQQALARREDTAQKWIDSYIGGMRDDLKRARKRFEGFAEKSWITNEHALSALADWTALAEVIEQLDADLDTLTEVEGEPLWTRVEIIAAKRSHYGSTSSSDPFHDALYKRVKSHWTKLLTTAVSVRLSAENHPARHLI